MKSTFSRLLLCCVLLSLAACPIFGQNDLNERSAAQLESLLAIYKHLHQAPELSGQEKDTSAFVAGELRQAGFTVTENVGKYADRAQVGYGIVGVMRNGSGPTVMLRTELDALPVEEKTGLPYASRVRAKTPGGEVGVMHACGHDLHMSVFLGTARLLSQMKERWHGTVVMIGQPAEEMVGGAKAMLNDGLYTRFPEPDYVLALHDSPVVPAGVVAWHEGPMLASSDSVEITVRGVGGHGAQPHMTKDPIVIASEIVLALQTIVSREINPLDPAVVTVGSFHAGTRPNIVPDSAHLQVTVRAFKPEVREHILTSIRRISAGVAAAAGVPADRAPLVEVSADGVPPTLNDAVLTRRVAGALERAMGREAVIEGQPITASEDFSLYTLAGKHPPSCMLWLGATDPEKLKQANERGITPPGLHSSQFAPDVQRAIPTGVKAMTSAVLDLLGSKP